MHILYQIKSSVFCIKYACFKLKKYYIQHTNINFLNKMKPIHLTFFLIKSHHPCFLNSVKNTQVLMKKTGAFTPVLMFRISFLE